MPDISRAYSWAIETCNAPNVGYSQSYRNQQTVNGITYYDCSSFINYSLLAGGFDTPSYAPRSNSFTTYTMGAELLRLGFHTVDPNGELKPGDIGVNSGHTEMCYKGGLGRGIFMGAHTSNALLANQVSIGSSGGNAAYETLGSVWTQVYRYEDGASGYGSSAFVVAAICGNWWQESNINPGVWEGLRVGTWTEQTHGYGLGQWTNTGGDVNGRLWQLHEYLSQNGYTDDSGIGQLNFLITENVWYYHSEYGEFSNLQDFINSQSTDLAYLTHAFNLCWEGIHDASWDARIEYAKKCYDYIIEHANDTSITDWIVGNRYLSDEERLNNAVMVYRYLSAGGGGGGTPTKRKKKMPVWMWIKYHY